MFSIMNLGSHITETNMYTWKSIRNWDSQPLDNKKIGDINARFADVAIFICKLLI